MDYRLQSPYCGGAMKISSQQKGKLEYIVQLVTELREKESGSS